MPSPYEEFWANSSFAFVANSAQKPFSELSYVRARNLGKKIFAADASVDRVEGDPAYADLDSLPEKPEAVVLDVLRGETREWVKKVTDAGTPNLWIHMARETPEAVALAEERA